jgi:hypothetical protein
MIKRAKELSSKNTQAPEKTDLNTNSEILDKNRLPSTKESFTLLRDLDKQNSILEAASSTVPETSKETMEFIIGIKGLVAAHMKHQGIVSRPEHFRTFDSYFGEPLESLSLNDKISLIREHKEAFVGGELAIKSAPHLTLVSP